MTSGYVIIRVLKIKDNSFLIYLEKMTNYVCAAMIQLSMDSGVTENLPRVVLKGAALFTAHD